MLKRLKRGRERQFWPPNHQEGEISQRRHQTDEDDSSSLQSASEQSFSNIIQENDPAKQAVLGKSLHPRPRRKHCLHLFWKQTNPEGKKDREGVWQEELAVVGASYPSPERERDHSGGMVKTLVVCKAFKPACLGSTQSKEGGSWHGNAASANRPLQMCAWEKLCEGMSNFGMQCESQKPKNWVWGDAFMQ